MSLQNILVALLPLGCSNLARCVAAAPRHGRESQRTATDALPARQPV